MPIVKVKSQPPDKVENYFCPKCRSNSVALVLLTSPNKETVSWCENGHVMITMTGFKKQVFDFSTWLSNDEGEFDNGVF